MTIDKICKKYGIKNYTINGDGSIDVVGDVYLSFSELTELPLTFNKVTGYFNCGGNSLTTLKGCPRWVGDYFRCNYNNLTSLEFSPEYVGGNFSCRDNELTSLEFSPEYVGGDFYCNISGLTDLVGSPKEVGGDFSCSNNKNLITIKGCSEKIGDMFYCSNTPLSSIFNGVDKHFLHAFNFYKVIKDDTVNLKRLKYVMDLYDQPIDLDEIKKYYRIV